MYLLWIASTAAAMFAVVIAPDVASYFDLDEAAYYFARYLRRKWRQTWLKVWRTNMDWGNR